MASTIESFPAFFDEAPQIVVRDPLAQFLGAAPEGVLRYRYTDAVRLAGHSCPTVACAYLMTRAALRALYGDELPERGAVRVQFRERAQEGVTGVIANVVALITGVTVDTGFKGLAGRFDRRQLLAFDQPQDSQLRFTRTDNGRAVSVSARAELVGGDPRMRELMGLCVQGMASSDELELFGALWQDRVRRLLLEHADDPDVILVH